MPSFKVINGGGGGKSNPDPGPEPPSGFRPDPLAEALWEALDKPATSTEEIYKRISKLHKRTRADVARAIRHCRKYADAYGWTILPVAKGSTNERRLYIRVLVDGDFKLSEYDLEVRAGLGSALQTIATQAHNVATALEFAMTADDITRSQKRKYHAWVGTLRSVAKTANEALLEVRK